MLLCNAFGPSLAVFFFEKSYQSASASDETGDWKTVKMYLPSLPYSGNIQISEQIEGLVRQENNFYNPTEVYHENDTLYVTLKSNQAARDRFFELANVMQNSTDAETNTSKSPFGKVLKQLTSLVKDYIPKESDIQLYSTIFISSKDYKPAFVPETKYLSFKSLLSTPPPELS
ncbi:hypothetical protein FEN17_01540 [Dyadobacter luticola]|uniref:Uncharacterized protein n=1 Tax=Dyadobacter luticola TaxID=1979387 RepID=A0A5R9L6E3_9BACT|nr:hypothetical protein FEN17_01540 [Dyadobacter luticola]